MIAILDGEEAQWRRFGVCADRDGLDGGRRAQRTYHAGRVELGREGTVVRVAGVHRQRSNQRECYEQHGGPASYSKGGMHDFRMRLAWNDCQGPGGERTSQKNAPPRRIRAARLLSRNLNA